MLTKDDHDAIIDAYCDDSDPRTCQELAVVYEVSRQRINQILKDHGVSADEGGAAKKMEIKKRQHLEAKEMRRRQRIENRWDMPYSRYAELLAMRPSPIKRFQESKKMSRYNDIEWDIGFEDWWRIWEASGHWYSRGKSGGGYCMVRKDKSLPVRADNVVIVPKETASMMKRN